MCRKQELKGPVETHEYHANERKRKHYWQHERNDACL